MAKAKKNYIYAVGKRKSSTSRVRLYKGSEENTVNTILIGKYFPGESSTAAWSRPFELTELVGKYYFTARVTGGGKKGQIDAVIHGISRAIAQIKDEHKKVLRKAGLLTRDSRIRERRKMGMGGKARRKMQSPKR
jgi:small subunit ribosomal protein S9